MTSLQATKETHIRSPGGLWTAKSEQKVQSNKTIQFICQNNRYDMKRFKFEAALKILIKITKLPMAKISEL